MLKIVSLLLCLLMIIKSSTAQNCTEELLVQKPGIWKVGMKGSQGGTPTELAKEKKTVEAIHNMIRSKYSPTGVEAVYHGAYNPAYPNTPGNNYSYSIIPLNYYCDGKAIKTVHETPSYFSITANFFDAYIYESPDYSEATSGVGYHFILDMPVQKNGVWYFKARDEGFGYTPTRQYSRLITYDGKLPFAYVTKKEFLEARKVILANAKRQSESQFKDVLDRNEMQKGFKEKEYKNDPEKLKKYMSMDYENIKARYEKLLSDNAKNFAPAFQKIESQLKMDEADLSKPAIVKMDPHDGLSYLFVEDDDPMGQVLIKPNPAYFNKKLPRSSPQFFWVYVRWNYTEPVASHFSENIMKAVDFAALKNMLGK